MKTLYLNRHAKSSWKATGATDHERPLNDRGMVDAPRMAARLQKREGEIDLFLSSTANRAKTTAEYFADSFSIKKLELEDKIYLAGPHTLLEIVNDLPNTSQSAILFGHNPGFSELASLLTGERIEMPTCGLAKIEFSIDDWQAVSYETGSLVYFDYPKNTNKI